jgi:hypothetical protein
VAIRIDESFEVDSPPDRVWAFLIDPTQVVQCLPGAELLTQEDARTFTGRIRVKVGPVTAAYRGRAHFEEVDEAARRVRLSGDGQESTGGGGAKMKMTSSVTSLPDGGTRVQVESEVEVVGRLVQFGRGMMEEVSRQIFQQFAQNVRSKLEAEHPLPVSAQAVAQPAAAPPPSPQPQSQPVRALPLILRALRELLLRLLRRRK